EFAFVNRHTIGLVRRSQQRYPVIIKENEPVARNLKTTPWIGREDPLIVSTDVLIAQATDLQRPRRNRLIE
ncbi:hypothetical protein, partial [Pseudomonas aeruginosa]|uniref:hypothetical protein n=1 Tax=Pseudomonas aeruginosa TaxID=287 RepID=UPI0031B675CE